MYVSHAQFSVFIACVFYGAVSAIFFELFTPIKKIIKPKFINEIIDFLIFVIVALGFNVYAYNMRFGDFRIFIPIGVFIGAFISFKSFNFALAKLAQKLYNIFKRRKRKKKGNDGTKA